ncbi:hypothetical protein chiPu_0027449, partial [Chiloscyllium punctatum]|nr:hypothetical protein [Chiloscyllium punctatum]
MPCPCSGELTPGSESRPFPEIPDPGGAFPVEGPSMRAGTPSSAGSASSTGSEGSPPWARAVLLSRDAREPTTPPAPTPSPSPGDEGSPGGELEVGGASPDEVVLDPVEAEFLQSDVWHQNWAFVPIGTIMEGAEGESPPHPPLPMDYEASEGGAGTDGILTDGAGTDGILTDGADTDGIL